jgi:hypothetical protein
MQFKGFIAGAAVVALAWLGSTAWDNYSAELRAGSMHGLNGIQASAQGMTEAEKEAHVAEMRRLWQSMTPAQREAYRNRSYCPYSGQGAHGRARGAAPGEVAPALCQEPRPIDI